MPIGMLPADVDIDGRKELLAIVIEEDDRCRKKDALWPRLEE